VAACRSIAAWSPRKADLAADGNRYNRSAHRFSSSRMRSPMPRHDRNSSLEPFSKPSCAVRCFNFGPNCFRFLPCAGAGRRQETTSHHRAGRTTPASRRRHAIATVSPCNTQPALLRSIDADGKCRPEAIDADPAHDVPRRDASNIMYSETAMLDSENRQLAGAAVSIVHAAQARRRRCYKAHRPARMPVWKSGA